MVFNEPYFLLKQSQSFVLSLMLFNIMIIISNSTTGHVDALSQHIKVSVRRIGSFSVEKSLGSNDEVKLSNANNCYENEQCERMKLCSLCPDVDFPYDSAAHSALPSLSASHLCDRTQSLEVTSSRRISP